ncbi:MAG: protein translocase subunit SecF [Chloroflexi bacterium]|nr:protein translocase subunit SecF [Chloroflexota bacterium]
MFDFVSKRNWFFLLSALVILPGVLSLALFGLRPGIEFTSGSLLTLQFEREVEQAALREELGRAGHGEAVVQRTSEGSYLVRVRPLDQGAAGTTSDQQPEATERQALLSQLEEAFGPVDVLSYDTVSPIVATEIVRNSALAVVVASAFIMLYIWWAFRHVPNPLRYGVSAILALVHDVLVVLGSFSILGVVAGVEVDSMFITAVLTVIGFSVHDTIVVFDRIRENMRREAGRPFAVVVNHSLLQTMGRSLTTSLTVILTLVALLLFGGVTIRPFLLALLIGITVGTYSSIFIASMILVVWERGDLARLLGHRKDAAALPEVAESERVVRPAVRSR